MGTARPGNAGGIGLHAIPAADTAALAGLMDRAARDALERERGLRPRVLCGYEAGYEGFRLARRLARLGGGRCHSGGRSGRRMEEGAAFLEKGRAGVWPNASWAETRRLMDRAPPCGTSRP